MIFLFVTQPIRFFMRKFSLITHLLLLGTSALIASPTAYVTNYSTHSVSIVDLTLNATTGYVNPGVFTFGPPVALRFSSDAAKAYLVCDSGVAFVIDTETNTAIAQINDENGPFNAPNSFKMVPNGTKAYVVNEGNNTVSVVDLSLNSVSGYVTDISTFNLPISIAISLMGQKLMCLISMVIA